MARSAINRINSANRCHSARSAPLEPPELEVFVRAYRNSFDGLHAATKAGYASPNKIWAELLAREDVQARLRHYRAGLDRPDRSRAGLVEDFCAKIAVDLSSVIIVDPVTGQPSYDLRHASTAQLGALDIRETIRHQGGKVVRTTQIQPRATAQELGALIRHFGLHVPDQDEGIDSFQAFIIELSKRGSPMPIATQYDTDDEVPRSKS